MPEPRVWRDRVHEVGTVFHRARLVDRNGNVMVQANYSGNVRIRAFDLNSDDADTAVFQTSNAIAGVITNTLQPWEVDGTGWNFERGVTTNDLAREGGHTYRFEYFVNHTTEGQHTILYENEVLGARGV